jgi:hypothetical protein
MKWPHTSLKQPCNTCQRINSVLFQNTGSVHNTRIAGTSTGTVFDAKDLALLGKLSIVGILVIGFVAWQTHGAIFR